MEDSLQIAGGKKERMGRLRARSLGYCTDTEELFIGGADGNVLLGAAQMPQRLAELEGGVNALREEVERMGRTITELEARVAALEGGGTV